MLLHGKCSSDTLSTAFLDHSQVFHRFVLFHLAQGVSFFYFNILKKGCKSSGLSKADCPHALHAGGAVGSVQGMGHSMVHCWEPHTLSQMGVHCGLTCLELLWDDRDTLEACTRIFMPHILLFCSLKNPLKFFGFASLRLGEGDT